ncbi:hypothetical protein Sm713_64780 [Streptomyces sp. TS71-3]|nr:hypothetical protein Sm713_64780 [Streptomyces sp. TS71-3]
MAASAAPITEAAAVPSAAPAPHSSTMRCSRSVPDRDSDPTRPSPALARPRAHAPVRAARARVGTHRGSAPFSDTGTTVYV